MAPREKNKQVVGVCLEMAANLTEEQRLDIEEAFNLFDKKKGKLDAAGLGSCLRYLGINLTNSDLAQLAGNGIDKNGLLDWFGKKFVVEDTETDVLKSFEVFDREGNGLITVVELRHVLTGLGEKLDPEQVETLIVQADQGDGQVAYKTFVQLMLSNQKKY